LSIKNRTHYKNIVLMIFYEKKIKKEDIIQNQILRFKLLLKANSSTIFMVSYK
jgi:hypothetical protein